MILHHVVLYYTNVFYITLYYTIIFLIILYYIKPRVKELQTSKDQADALYAETLGVFFA